MSKKKQRRKGRCDNSRTRDIDTRVPFNCSNVSTKFVPKKLAPDDIYEAIFKKNQFMNIQKFIFDSKQWKRYYFQKYEYNHSAKRNMRQIVMYDTVLTLMRGKYFLVCPKKSSFSGLKSHRNSRTNDKDDEESEGEYSDNFLNKDEKCEDDFEISKVFIPKKTIIQSVKSTKYYSNEHSFKDRQSTTFKETEISVIEGDCLEETIRLKNEERLNPCMLIMCSRTFPGGNYEKAPKSQEENLCRRSNLFMCLADPYKFDRDRSWNYPHPEFGSVYVPKCIVFRSSESEGYQYLEKPINISMLTQYCYAHPPVEKSEKDGHFWIKGSKLLKRYLRKIETILQVALEHRHDSLVLSAFGCGVYENPPNHIAELFRQVIFSKKFHNKFKKISFAILSDQKNNKNLEAFQEVFG